MAEAWSKPLVSLLPAPEGQMLVVGGRQVPHTLVAHRPDGTATVHIGASAFECDLTEVEQLARIAANALAVGAGYVAWPEADADFVVRSFAPRTHVVDMGGAPAL